MKIGATPLRYLWLASHRPPVLNAMIIVNLINVFRAVLKKRQHAAMLPF
jgi:hypothetical protein